MLKRVAIFVGAVALLIGAIGALLPRQWSVARSIRIEAPPERVLPFVANLRRWQDWAVWTKAMDPNLVNTFAGPEEGVGARWQWQGPVMGRGAMTVTAADLTGVSIDEAIESDVVNARGRLSFVPDGQGTTVTWSDQGTLPPMGGFFRENLEAMLGGHFEKGLSALKVLAEKQPPPQPLPLPSSLEGLAPADAGR
ncbi:MAG: SRPBCC family protein [Myxococcaceae bacterium]|nr:SRPBCC family protein [Myxococcaceae bacterium]